MVKGFRKQSQIICNKINVLINDAHYHKKNTLIEGIHLLPSLFSRKESEYENLKFVYIYITTSFQFFKNTLLPNRVISTYRHRKIDEYDIERLNRFRVFKEMWDSELTEYGITPIYNNSTPQVLLSRILELIVTNLKG
ncbi:MAG: hypothetical protein IJ220_03040 [Clostridia bacterium]|nr:hypothetical protein [Clostridia bacterium]